MTIALKELIRQPRRFLSVGGALTLLVLLLVVLGGFLDGLELSQTGPYRAHEDSVIVYNDGAERQLGRSRVGPDQRAELESASGVGAVGGLASTFTVAGTQGSTLSELEDIALFGYELGTFRLPAPPAEGSVVIDEQLQRITGIDVGDTLEIGPAAEPVTVAAVVDDITAGAPSVWIGLDQWRQLVASANPGAILPDGVSQALVVQPDDSVGSPEALVASLTDAGLDGIDPVTSDEAIGALDVVQQQSSTFRGIIGVTFVITLLVIALFFALITLERMGLYAVLKAIGARTGELLAGVSIQAVGVSVVALIVGFILSALFVAVLPPQLPVRIEPNRLVQIAIGTVLTALVGSLFTARRILRVDPASAIG